MWLDFGFGRRPTAADMAALESRAFELERALFEAEQFARIADDKLTAWVRKHDDLLIKYKNLISTHEPDITT